MRRLIATLTVLAVIFGALSPALAGGSRSRGTYTQTGPNRGEVAVGADEAGSVVGTQRGGRDPWAACQFWGVDDIELMAAITRQSPETVNPSPQGWWVVLCAADSLGLGEASYIWRRDAGLPPAVRDRLVSAAVAALEVPYLAPRSSPPGTAGHPVITGVDTWLWVDPGHWSARTATAAIAVASVTATATPTAITVTPGDGTGPITCAGPGRPWQPGPAPSPPSCGHRYERTSGAQPAGTWPLALTVTWQVTWACEPGCGAGTAAPFELSVTRPVVVEQIHTRLTR